MIGENLSTNLEEPYLTVLIFMEISSAMYDMISCIRLSLAYT